MNRRKDKFSGPIFRFWNNQWLVQMPLDYKHTSGQIVEVKLKNGLKKDVVLTSQYGNDDNLFYFREK